MRTIRRAPYLRPLAWLTAAAVFALVVGVPATPAGAQTDPFLPRLAVVQVVNQSGSSVENLASRAALAINERFAASSRFQVIGQEQVNQALQTTGITLPLRPVTRDEQLLRLAEALDADYLVLAAVTGVETDTGRQVGLVRSRFDVFGRAARAMVAEVETTAFSAERSANELVLLDDALEQNAMTAVRTTASRLALRGRVTSAPIEDTYYVSFGEDAPMNVGARLAVLRDGLRIATLQVLKFNAGQAETRLVERNHPSYVVQVNDEVSILSAGAGQPAAGDPDYDPIKQVPRPDERRSGGNTGTWIGVLLGLAAIGIGAWAVLSNNSSNDNRRSATLLSPPNGAQLPVDGLNQAATNIDFTWTTGTADASSVFQIADDPGFTRIRYTQTVLNGGSSDFGDQAARAVAPTRQEGSGTFVVRVAPGDVFLPPGTYFWRVIAATGGQQFTSQVFTFTVVLSNGRSVVMPGLAVGTLRAPETLSAVGAGDAVNLQWTPVQGASAYRVLRCVLTPPQATEARSSRAYQPEATSDSWLRGEGRRTRAERRNRLTGAPTRQDSGSLAGFEEVARVNGSETSYRDVTAQFGTEYRYVVLTEDGQGLLTPVTNAGRFVDITPLSAQPPAAPLKLTAVAGDGGVTLTWSPNKESDLAGYQVFRGTSAEGILVNVTRSLVVDPDSPSAQGLSAGRNDLNVVDRTAPAGTPVFYRVRAVQMTAHLNGVQRGGTEGALSDAVQPVAAPAR